MSEYPSSTGDVSATPSVRLYPGASLELCYELANLAFRLDVLEKQAKLDRSRPDPVDPADVQE